MDMEDVKLPKQLMENIRNLIFKTGLYVDEQDFISQAIIKQISKYK